jgi:hypothetical protein
MFAYKYWFFIVIIDLAEKYEDPRRASSTVRI